LHRARRMPDEGELSPEQVTLARTVLAYLASHPAARDTREGIADWWVRQQQIEYAAQDVARVVRFLVTQGLLLERPGPDQRMYYEINPANLDVIARYGS